MKKKRTFIISFFLISHFIFSSLYTHKKAGWTLDYPEGYSIEDKDYPTRITFRDQSGLISLYIFTLPTSSATSFISNKIYQPLQLQGQFQYFDYGNKKVWGGKFFHELPEGKGHIEIYQFNEKLGLSYILMASVETKYYKQAKAEINSLIDNFYPTKKSFLEPGFLFRQTSDFPDNDKIPYKIKFGNTYLNTDFSGDDNIALEELLNREKKILFQHRELNPLVMKRLYRTIYKSSYHLFDTFINSLKEYFTKNGMSKVEQFKFIYKTILNYNYEPLNGNRIITTPIQVILTQKGDCDAKSLLAYILLSHLNINVEFLVSFYYHHAAIGIPNSFFNNKRKVFSISQTGKELVFIELLKHPIQNIKNPKHWYSIKF